jgi:type IV fimbrial biogenesis protein FimT
MKPSHAHERPRMGPGAGFTLIELMVTIAIAAILLMVAAPSFVTMQRNSELTSVANSFVAAVNAARGEAMKRGANAMIVPVGANWTSGWNVFVDTDTARNGVLDATDTIVAQQPALASYFTASGTGTAGTAPAYYVMFDASGYARTKGAGFGATTLTITRNDLSGAEQTEQTRRIVIARTGRARACKPSTDATCTVTATE